MPSDATSLLNPLDQAYRLDPYACMREQREREPVHWNPTYQAWCCCDHASVKKVLTTVSASARRIEQIFARLPAAVRAEIATTIDLLKGWALMEDGAEHQFLRGVVNEAFAPRLIEPLVGRIQDQVDALLRPLRRDGGCDLMADVAVPLPAMVIGDILGLPRDRLEWLKTCSLDIAGIFRVSSDPDPAIARAGHQAMTELVVFIDELIAERRAYPREDMVTALVTGSWQDRAMTDHELRASLSLLLVAGHETTTNLIGNGMLTLFRHPEAHAALRADVRGVEAAVEEMVRFESPVQVSSRVLTEPATLAGIDIAGGERVVLFIGAANRDPAVFDDPDTFVVDRGDSRHLGFGAGRHRCVGAGLGRLEARVFFQALLGELPELRWTGEQPQWRNDPTLRGLTTLPVAVV